MLGKIIEIIDNSIDVELGIDINSQPNLIGLHAVFEDGNKKIIGEIVDVNKISMKINIVGELEGENFTPGFSAKPSFSSSVRLIRLEELETIFGKQTPNLGQTPFGTSKIYQNYKINVSINDFFSNHFSIIGNSGSGKSHTVASVFQQLFKSTRAPIKSNIFIFDAYGEYTNAFSQLNQANQNIHYKTYTTNTKFSDTEVLKIPIWLLDVDDLALLLDANTANQLPILEKTLKLVPILTGNSEDVIKHKNDIIARALEDILLSGGESTKIRDQVIAILTKFNTQNLNLESQIVQPGYTRTFKQCLLIDKSGKMQEMELIVDFIRGYISEVSDGEVKVQYDTPYYTLKDLEMAMEFALISEGILKSEKVYDYANILSVRLHNLALSEYSEYFNYPTMVTRGEYINELLTDKMTGNKAQIVNFNINYVDDRLAKVITKILSKMLFNIAANNQRRGSMPFHIVIEEAHRYVQNDKDIDLLGYNIFERITKEGRKYGVFLGLITQRPSELSDTAISQMSNFLILRILHPKDLDYIRKMVPNISSEIVEQLKSLKPGNCIAFGNAFKVPMSLYITRPNPEPLSNNVDLEKIWFN